MERWEELSQQQIQDCQAQVEATQKMLEDTESKFQTNRGKLEKEIAEVEERRSQLAVELGSFKEGKTKEIEELTEEVDNLTRQIFGKQPRQRKEPKETPQCQGRAKGRKRFHSVQLPILVSENDSSSENDSINNVDV